MTTKAPVVTTLKRIGKAIRDMELPAVEKISEEQAGPATTENPILQSVKSRFASMQPTHRAWSISV